MRWLPTEKDHFGHKAHTKQKGRSAQHQAQAQIGFALLVADGWLGHDGEWPWRLLL
jgi:hypothetical protein